MSQASQEETHLFEVLIKDTKILLKLNGISTAQSANQLSNLLSSYGDAIEKFQFENCDKELYEFIRKFIFDLKLIVVFSIASIDNLLKENNGIKVVQLGILKNVVQSVTLLTNVLKKLSKDILENSLKTNSLIIEASKPVLNVMHSLYRHCKNSQKAYGSNFSSASASLRDLFHSSFALQRVVASLLNKLHITSADTETADSLKYLSEAMFEICKTVDGIDNTLLFSSWKLFINFLSSSKTALVGVLDINFFLPSLTAVITAHVKQIVQMYLNNKEQLSTENAINKTLANLNKLSTLFVKLLLQLHSDFQLIENIDVSNTIIKMVLDVFENAKSFLVQDDKMPKENTLQIKNVIDEVEQCLVALLPSQSLENVIILPTAEPTEPTSPLALLLTSVCLSKIIVSNKNKDSLSIWFEGDKQRCSLLQAVFRLLPKVHSGLYFSPLLQIGKSKEPLFQAVVSHMCSMAAVYPAKSVPHLENAMLENLLSSHPHKNLLASDLWCFVARQNHSLCAKHVAMLAEVLSSDKTPVLYLDKVGMLLQRLFRFLQPNVQKEMILRHPFDNKGNLKLWQFLGPQFVENASDPYKVVGKVMENTTSFLKMFVEKKGSTKELSYLLPALKASSKILSKHKDKIHPKHPDLLSAASAFGTGLLHLWLSLPVDCGVTQALVTLYCDVAACVTGLLTLVYDNASLRKITKKALRIVDVNKWPNNELCLLLFRLVEMCEAFKALQLSVDIQHDLVLLWRRLILRSEVNWHLNHATLRSFERFSRATKHPQVVARVCTSEQSRDLDDVTKIGASVKSHLKRSIDPLPNGLTIHDVVRQNGRILLEADTTTNSDVISDVTMSSESLSDVVQLIGKNAARLGEFSAGDFNSNLLDSLRNSVAEITSVLPKS